MNTILKINLLLIFLFRIGLGIQVPQDPKINKYLMSIGFDYQLFNEIPLFSVDPKVNQNYQKLIYGEGFPNIQSFLEYRALMISRFLIEGYTMAIPEYIVVVNRCIEHINKTIKNIEYYDGERKTQNLNFRLSVLKKLVHRLEEYGKRDQFPNDLTYQEVIDFVVKTSIFTQKNHKDELADNHGYDSYDVLSRIIHQNEYIDLSYYVLDRYYSNIPESQEFPLSHQELLKKIKRPVLLPEFNYQESQRQTWPFTSNTASQLFFFIFTGEGKINFDHFNPLQASHFIDIPGINFNFTYHEDLYGFLTSSPT